LHVYAAALYSTAGVISRRTRENVVPIVENLPEHIGTALPLLKSSRTYNVRDCEIFSGPKCTISQDFAYRVYNLKF